MKFAVAGILFLAVAGVVASFWIDCAFVLVPPELDKIPDITLREVVKEGGLRRIGDSWIAERNDLLRMRLSGGPFELGYAHAKLTQEYIKAQEAEFLGIIRKFLPEDWKLWLIKKIVVVKNRGLDKHIKREYLVEIYGLSEGYDDPFPEIGPLYHRLVNYHAAHDIGHALINSGLVGCTSFAAKDEYTSNGRLWVGRNFDFDAARLFDERKVVTLFEPDEGLKFISVGWPGLAGIVTGINQERIFVSMNAASSSHKRRIGTPVSLVLREVLQDARNLQEAINIIRKAQVFVTDSYLVADGKSGAAAIVEKTPAGCAVVMMEEDFLASANHFVSLEFAPDAANINAMAEGTSVLRYERMRELIEKYSGRLDAPLIARILRDRSVSGIKNVGLGNEAAICGLVATHSVIADVTAGIIWVSASPHQLGAYVPFSLDGFDEPQGVSPVEADEILLGGRYGDYLESKEKLETARRCFADGDVSGARESAREAAELNPGYYEPEELLGRVAFSNGRFEEAAGHFEKALAAWPPFKDDREGIKEMLEKSRAKGWR